VCLLLIGGVSFWLGRSTGTAGSQVLITPSLSHASTNPPIPSPTPTAQIIAEGKLIPCTNCDGGVRLILERIVIDPSQDGMTVQFNITNTGQLAETFTFVNLTLQDDTGDTYQGGIQAIGQWDLGAGNSIIEVPGFSLLPKHGVHYTLRITMGESGLGVPLYFQDQSLTF
jgi:hypothetical protein